LRAGAPRRRALLPVLIGLVWAGCAAPAEPPELSVDLRRAVVSAEEPLTAIEVRDDSGALLARRRGGPEALQLSVAHGADPGSELSVTASSGGGTWDLRGRVPPDPGPLRVEIDVPAGQGPVSLGGDHRFTVVEGSTVQAGFVITARDPSVVTVRIGDASHEVATTVGDERRVLFVDVPVDGPSGVVVASPAGTRTATVHPTVITREAARRDLALGDIVFPADALGYAEAARPAGRVTLPAGWWRSLLRATGVGYRTRNPYGPWAFQGIPLVNHGDAAINVVVEARVVDSEGLPADPFRPKNRDREGETGLVAGLVRVPAGGSTLARLPFFVDAGELPEGSTTWTREISVTPLGSSEPLWTRTEPLQVKQGSSWISLAFGFSLLSGLLGALLVASQLRRRLRALRTRDLVTIAVFATLGFLVSGISAVVSAATSAVLGPFSIFLTNLLDDVLRYALLATLVTLLPRPGVVALSVLLTWVMRGIALGSFSPIDVVYVGSKVLWVESALWIAGITRVPDWVDGSAVARWLRLGVAFGTSSVLTALTGLVVAMVLYRLFYADWYVAAVLAGPGFLYVWIACALGTGFASSLRRVED